MVRKEEGPYRRIKIITVEEALAAFRRANLYSGAKDDLLGGKTVSTMHDKYRLICQGCDVAGCECGEEL